MLSHSDTSHMWSCACAYACYVGSILGWTTLWGKLHLPPAVPYGTKDPASVIMLLGQVRPRPGRVQTKETGLKHSVNEREPFSVLCMAMAQAF